MKNTMILLCLLLSSTAFAVRPAKVFIQCAVSQGNGFNWASTLGWLSETTRQSANKVRSFEKRHPGKKAYIDLQCFNGASSASFVAALFDQLLNNRHIINTPMKIAGRDVLTAAQASRLADALHFMALATDFSAKESKKFIGGAIRYKVGIHRKWDEQNNLRLDFWRPSSNIKTVLDSVSSRVNAARNIPLNSKHLKLLKTPKFTKRSAIPTLRYKDFQAMKVDQISKMKKVRNAINDYIKPNEFAAFYRKDLEDHICTSVFLQPAIKKMVIPFSYDDLQIAFMCNDKTYQKLIHSQAFKKILSQSSITKNRIIVATAQDWGTALNVSSREPELLSLISGRLNHSHLGMNKVKVFKNGKFVTLDTNKNYLVIGGFPEQRMQAWVPYALMLEQQKIYENKGIETDASLSVFGKTDIRDRIASFAEKTIAKYFGGEDKLS
jgi:hypothetical protein